MGTKGRTAQRLYSSYLKQKKFEIKKSVPSGSRNSAGVGYLMIPIDIDRELWIKSCYRKGQVSLLNENERIDNVVIGKHIFQELEFPSTPQELGTKLVWVSTIKNVVAIAVINKNNEIIELVDDKNFSIIKKNSKEATIEICGNVEEENLIINIDSKTGKAGKLLININNPKNLGEFNVLVNGKIIMECDYAEFNILEKLLLNIQNIKGDKDTKIQYIQGEGFSYIDEFENTITIDKNGKFDIKNNKYSITELFIDIINEISLITVATAIGTQPILNKIQVEQLKQNVKKILS